MFYTQVAREIEGINQCSKKVSHVFLSKSVEISGKGFHLVHVDIYVGRNSRLGHSALSCWSFCQHISPVLDKSDSYIVSRFVLYT